MQPLVEGIDYYLDDRGLMVLTEKFLRERGYCCGNGCLECPFNYENVAEPRRSELIRIRNSSKDR
jgi:hypothetical protein